ncbi:MAG TPA: HAD family phosphatase, partial [Candidatus Saccharimonadales bacterium]|nr:HAD family phosphatase [Candidatus Saccharimonadales bacterium]
IKAICFDLDGVYFTPQSFQDFKKALPKEKNDEDTVNYVLYKSPEMLNFKLGKMEEEDYWKYATWALGINATYDQIYKLLRDSYQVNQEVVDYVQKVRAAGFKTCICSNNFVTRIRELNNKFGFLDLFDVQVFSYKVGYIKPDKRIFEELVSAAEVAPEEIVYSDDDEQKMDGAKELGINTFVYTNFEDFKKNLESLGVSV